MQSRMTIEVDFNNGNQPFFQVKVAATDDMRDRMVAQFFERLGHQSTWAKVTPAPPVSEGGWVWKIEPITPQQLSEESHIMLEQIRVMGNSPR